MKHATAYLRKGEILIHSSSQTTCGVWIATEPYLKVAVDDAPATIGRAIIEAIDASHGPVPHPTEWDWIFKPMLALSGAKSWAAFMKPALSVGLESANGVLTMSAWKNEGARDGGYSPLLGRDMHLPSDSPPEAIAAALFQAFDLCE